MMKSVFNSWNNLTQRIIAGLIGAFIMVGCVIWDEWSYFSVFFLICLLTQFEFYKLIGMNGLSPLKFFGTIIGGILFVLTFLIEMNFFPVNYYLLLFPVIAVIFFIKLYNKDDRNPFVGIAFTLCGIFYVAIPFSLLNIAAFSNGYYSFEIILGLILILWGSETGAYFAGNKFGRTTLFHRVSPKKTWEGSIGGAVLAGVITFFIARYSQDLASVEWYIIGAIIVVVGTYGDLVESLFKRSIEIKDSGNLIPGHGGFMDRFDGLLLSSYFIVVFLKLF